MAHNITGSASSSPRVIDFPCTAKNAIILFIRRALLTHRGQEVSPKHSEVVLCLARFGQPGGIRAVFLHGHDLHRQVLLTPFVPNFKKILGASSATLGTEWAMLSSFSCLMAMASHEQVGPVLSLGQGMINDESAKLESKQTVVHNGLEHHVPAAKESFPPHLSKQYFQ